MDRNGYFFYVASTAKKKKISLMQPKPPRVAFVDENFEKGIRRPGLAERIHGIHQVSVAAIATEYGRGDSMSARGPSPAPRARLYSQLESYQPRYHTIRENYGSGSRYSENSVKNESECRKRRKERPGHPGHPQAVIR
ncbi:hypothetical protein O0L34_g11262 [Tuta absoluta]|nr:hypothetical protein O0L34_g2189 [Tuta absoluta]KAJ2949938.1 hypothetical protein O0L34_g11262 [Tuta absoluta]